MNKAVAVKRGRGRPRKVQNAVVAQAEVVSDIPVLAGTQERRFENYGGLDSVFSFPQSQGSPYTAQLSQPTTVFKNLRWWLVSNMRQMLSEAYVEIALIQTLCCTPVDDALRGGVDITSKQLSPEEISKLQISLDRDADLTTVGQAATWNRLYGGAGVIILTDQDPETPLDLAQISEDEAVEFRAVDMWELTWDKQEAEGYDPTIQEETFDFYNYYGVQVHKSRVMKLKGLEAPSFIRPRLRGWGFSIVEKLVRSINQYLKATDLTFEVLDEFKVDVYKIKNLVDSLMSPIGAQKVYERVQMGNLQKNYQHALVMDSEDEFDHKQISFSGLAEAMEGIRIQIASDMRFPILKLFGTPAQGLNASDEDSIEVYNSMVEVEVRDKIKYIILRICEIKCQKLFGFIPDDLAITYKPLRIMSSEQEETVKTQKFTRLLQARAAGEITLSEFRSGCNKDNLLPIQLDDLSNADELNPGTGDTVKEESGMDPNEPVDTDDEGSNREDTRKSKATEEGGIPKGGPVKPPAPKSKDAPNLKLNNSLEYDRASFEADTDTEITARQYFFQNPKNPGLWQMAQDRALKIYGKPNWKFSMFFYKKEGGTF